MNLIEFTYESNRSTDPKGLTDTFLKFLSGYGLTRFVMSDMSHDSTASKERHHGIVVNYPEEWMNHYIAHNYIDHDPVYQTALIAHKPFTWREVQERPKVSTKALRVMNEAHECKLYDGVGLSIHRPFGEIFGMGFAASDPGTECNKDVISCVHAAANQFFAVYADLSGLDNLRNEKVNITPREREVLLWLARGKTKSEISDILLVSESCVKRHCEKTFSKLQVNNIPMAIAKALRMGLIKPY